MRRTSPPCHCLTPPETVLPAARLRARLALAAVMLAPLGRAQGVDRAAPQPLLVDASAAQPAPEPSAFVEGSHVAPDGRSITLNSRFLIRDGVPWLPVMGEIHYTRVPQELWEQELLKMKAGGVQVIATYIFWIHHEEVEGRFEWSGRRDLRRFVQLCSKHGLLVQLRIGPWDHGEVRNGGFPDWLVRRIAAGDLRRNTPAYMAYVRTFYEQVGLQVRGLLWKDGGPVIGVQLENEYGARGAHAGNEYVLALKRLAIQSGFDVPFYIVTGWDNAVIPAGAVLPVFGGYMDAPWSGSLEQLEPSEVYAFRFGGRVSGDMGAGGASDATLTAPGTPFLTAEMGGGMQVTYHRRPVIDADDVAAMYPVMLGSGVNLYGTYMFHGGENPEGKLSTLQESQATGYPNDVAVKNYDFGAPLGEFGQERESFRKLKVVNYFVNDFGSLLAPMAPHAPDVVPRNPADESVPRLSVRTDGRSGFVFFNNYVRYYPMPRWLGVQISVKLPQEVLGIPRQPVAIPSGAYGIWPFNISLGGAILKYSTAQLFTKLGSGQDETYFFVAVPGIEPEFAFDAAAAAEATEPGTRVSESGGVRYISGIAPALAPAIELRPKAGAHIRIVVLSQSDAENAWKARVDGEERLLLTPQQFFSDESHAYLQSIGSPDFSFRLVPPPARAIRASQPIHEEASAAGAARYSARAPAREFSVHAEKLRDAGPAPEVRYGPPAAWRNNRAVAEPPEDGAYASAARWRIVLPREIPADLSEVFLEVRYVGDVARLYAGDRLLEDDFFAGPPWTIGLRRFAKEMAAGPLELAVVPLRDGAPVFLEKGYRPAIPRGGQIAELLSLEAKPEYQLRIDAPAK